MKPSSVRNSLAAAVASVGLALGWWASGFGMPDRSARPIPVSSPTKPPRPFGRSSDPLAAGIAGIWAAGNASAQAAAAVAWARALAPEDFGRALAMLDRLPSHAAQPLAKQTILRRWVAQDPEAAFRWALGHDTRRVGTVVAEWIRNDPSSVESVIALVESLPPGDPFRSDDTREDALGMAFVALAPRDREAAMNLLGLYELPLWQYDIDRSLRVMARDDPAWVLERAESLRADVRADVRKSVADALMDDDPAAAIEWARHQPDREQLLREVALHSDKLPALITALAALSPEEQTVIRFSGYLDLGEQDPLAVVDALESQAPNLSPAALEGLLRGSTSWFLAADDPGALANRLMALNLGRDAFSPAGFAEAWSREAPDEARAWAAALTDESQRSDALQAIEEATQPPQESPVLSPLEETIQEVKHGKLRDPETLLALHPDERRHVLDTTWAQELANERSREQRDKSGESFADILWVYEAHPPLGGIFDQISRRYPEETARWISDSLTVESTPKLMETLTSTAAHWAAENPGAAATWAESLPPGDTRAWAAVNVFDQWRQFDEQNARAWWESLPAEERARTSSPAATQEP